MDKELNSFLKSISDFKGATFKNNKIVIKAAGSKLADWILIFFLLIITLFFLWMIYSYGFLISNIGEFLIFFCCLCYLYIIISRGDNILTVDLFEKKLYIKKRSFLLQFISVKTINFQEIKEISMNKKDTDDSSSVILEISALKTNGLFKKINLISFSEANKKIAFLLLYFLRTRVKKEKE